jgi:hypothetical protein
MSLFTLKEKEQIQGDDDGVGVKIHKVAHKERRYVEKVRLSHFPLSRMPYVGNVRRILKRKRRDPLEPVKKVRLKRGYGIWGVRALAVLGTSGGIFLANSSISAL